MTRILSDISQGDPRAADQLLPLVYDELRKLAAAKLANEKPGKPLQATALVHDAYIRLVDVENAQQWDSKRHFFAAAAEAMRQILVENARRNKRLRHGGERNRVDLPLDASGVAIPVEAIVAVNDALDLLAESDVKAAEIVKLHYYSGLTLEETSDILSISPRSTYRLWAYARAWLRRHLRDGWKPDESD